jgi:hypothetical protein
VPKLIDSLIGICQACFIIGGAWWGYSYYSGRVQFSGDAEKRRQERVKKYGEVLAVAIIGCAFTGIILLFIKIYEISFYLSK